MAALPTGPTGRLYFYFSFGKFSRESRRMDPEGRTVPWGPYGMDKYAVPTYTGTRRGMLPLEQKTGLIPEVVIEDWSSPSEYAVLLTNYRAIFVLEYSSFAASMGHALGGVVGQSIAQALYKGRTFDYDRIDPEYLARDPKNRVVLHAALESIELRRHLGGIYHFHLRYRRPDGSSKKLNFFLSPPKEYFEDRRRAGVKRLAALYEYIRNAQDVYRASIPPSVPVQATWIPSIP